MNQRLRRSPPDVVYTPIDVTSAHAVKAYYVYIMSSFSKRLYVGVTNNLHRRMYEHKNHLIKGFTKRYNLAQLVYYEATNDIHSAISREKQIKGWVRRRKIALVESANPEWDDLSETWFEKVTVGQKAKVSVGKQDSSVVPTCRGSLRMTWRS